MTDVTAPDATAPDATVADVTTTGGRAARLDRALADLLVQAPELEAAAVVSYDGLAMASALPPQLDESRLAAMSAALLSLGEKAAEGLGRGDLSQVWIEGAEGTVFLVSAEDEAVLVAVAARGAKAGLMLYEVRRAAAAVAVILRDDTAGPIFAPSAPAADAVPAPPVSADLPGAEQPAGADLLAASADDAVLAAVVDDAGAEPDTADRPGHGGLSPEPPESDLEITLPPGWPSSTADGSVVPAAPPSHADLGRTDDGGGSTDRDADADADAGIAAEHRSAAGDYSPAEQHRHDEQHGSADDRRDPSTGRPVADPLTASPWVVGLTTSDEPTSPAPAWPSYNSAADSWN